VDHTIEVLVSGRTSSWPLTIQTPAARRGAVLWERLAEHFRIQSPSIPDFGPSYNVQPLTFQPVIRFNRETGEREIVLMCWGLIPFWMLSANPQAV
jgi:putative SOS response-associated peptidase YedK